MDYFTRRETAVLTRTSLRRLAYLAKTNVVVPTLIDGGEKQVYYSWEQILELRTIQYLRRQVSLQTVRKILAFLERVSGDRALHDKHLLIADGEVTWVQAGGQSMPQVVQVAARSERHVGQLQLTVMPSLTDLRDALWDTTCHSNVVDFESFRQKASQPQSD